MPRSPADPSPEAAKQHALRLLAARELSRAQLRERLRRRGFEVPVVDSTLDRLAADGLLDDDRAARARARHEAVVRRHGPGRALQQIRAMGVDRDIARDAVRDVFDEVDEDDLMDQALARRLKGGPLPTDDPGLRRLYAWLLRQGFEPARVSARLRRRAAWRRDE